jgi:ubiquinone/menaquinone biosynthesis C-methylase UbiE/outer membrane protein assembly factor BamB
MPRLLLVFLLFSGPGIASAADWPQWRGAGRDNRWPEKGLPERLPAKLEPSWKQPIGGGYGGIAVAGGRVLVLDRQTDPREVERVLCLEAATGKKLWSHEYPVRYGKMEFGNGPRSTPTVHRGKVYTLGALGHLFCLDAKSGKVLWSRDTVKEFSGRVPTWGHACSLLIDGERAIVQVGGQPGACLVALHVDSGKEVWRSLDDRPGYSSPVVVDTGKWRQLVYFTPQHVVGLEPDTGKRLWSVPFEGIDYDVSISDVVCADGVLLASNYWSGSKAIQLNERGGSPKVVWEGKALSLLMSTPLVRGKHVFALDRFRGLKCIEMPTGKVAWEGKHVTPRDTNPQASLVWVDDERALILNTPGELLLVKLTPAGLEMQGKVSIIGKTWAHPGFGDGCVFARSDTEIVCVPLVSTAAVAPPQEKSVRPGINDPFKNPDVKKFQQTFEAESREIFAERKQILAACKIKPGMTVADIGAGTGLFSRLFAAEVGPKGKVYAVDIAENFLEHIRKSCKEAKITNVETVRCTDRSCELRENSIDLAFICDTYHHFEFPSRTMASIHKALRPGGQVVVVDFHRIFSKSRVFILLHVRAGQEVFEKEIVSAGFKKVAEEKIAGLKENYFVRFEKVEAKK